MNDQELDAVAEIAVERLADQLAAELGPVLDGAVRRALERVTRELEARAGEVGAATDRAAELLASVGDEMRTRASQALGEGVHSQVIPALKQKGAEIAADTGQRLEPVVRSIETLLAVEGKSLAGAVAMVDTALRESVGAVEANLAVITHQIRDGFDGATTEIRTRAGETATLTRQRIASTEKALQEQLRAQGAASEGALARVLPALGAVEQSLVQRLAAAEGNATATAGEWGQALQSAVSLSTLRLEERCQTLERQLGELREESRQLAVATSETVAARGDALAGALQRGMAAQERRLLKLWRAGLATIGMILLVLVVLFVLMGSHH